MLERIAQAQQGKRLEDQTRNTRVWHYHQKAYLQAIALESHLHAIGTLCDQPDGFGLLEKVRDLQFIL